MIAPEELIRTCRTRIIDIEDSVSELNDFSEIFTLLIESLGEREPQSRIDALTRVASSLWDELFPQLQQSIKPLVALRMNTDLKSEAE